MNHRGVNFTWQNLDDAEQRRLEKAIMLAPTLTLCEAMLRGEHVPVDQLDPTQVRQYGIRPA